MDILWYDLLKHGIGAVGVLLGALAFQCNKHSSALLLKMAEEGTFGIYYIFLGGYTGAVLNLVGILRNLLFVYLGKKDDQKRLKYARIGMAVLFAILGFCSWEGYLSLLIVFAKVLSTLAYGTTNMTKMRIMVAVTCVCWIFYNASLGSVFGMISDSSVLISTVIGMIRYDILKKTEPVKK